VQIAQEKRSHVVTVLPSKKICICAIVLYSTTQGDKTETAAAK